MTDKSKRKGRPRKGQLIPRKTGWYARFWTFEDGVEIRVCRPTGITDMGRTGKAKAARKMAQWIAGGTAPTKEEATAAETFAEAGERVHEGRADTVANAKDEIASLRTYVFPEIGTMPVTKIETKHINVTLDYVKSEGLSKQTAQHIRQRISNVFAQLKREGVVLANPVEDAELPTYSETVQKERAVLSDDELVVYLGYVHPQEWWQMAILERQVMACIARMFGGLRTGDLHALEWTAFDLPDFAWGWAPRQKTKRPQRLGIPEMLRPILRDWWERQGRPTSGLLFPARRGKRTGKGKIKVSHAAAFRRDLERAFGVFEWRWDPPTKKGEQKTGEYVKVREYTEREIELFTETKYTLPVDWHSWRRAYSQALADGGVNAQTSKALAGHASDAAHNRYLMNSSKVRELPAAALPQIAIKASSLPKSSDVANENSLISAGRTGLEPAASGVTGGTDTGTGVNAPRATTENTEQFEATRSVGTHVHTYSGSECLNSLPKIPSVDLGSGVHIGSAIGEWRTLH